MERETDAQLVRRTLLGDDGAFSILVQKHQKGIQAVAWRKVGDFHVAEEITQDTFLQAYKKLSTLRNPQQFAGWLYVIANRMCLRWLKKNKTAMQSLEDTSVEIIDGASYKHHEDQQRESEAQAHRHALVKKLLAKLPESERTVVTLYYLGEMTTKEIGKYLGVSVNTITSRLRRGRKRLQEEQEETLVEETLQSLQIPTDLTESIMGEVADLSPTPTPTGKPFLPWVAFGTSVILALLILGVSSHYLTRFQQPYSFEAESEPTIEIIDAFFVIDSPAKPAVRNRFGRATTPRETSSTGTQTSDTTSTSITQQNPARFSTTKWAQGNSPPGGPVRNVLGATDGTLLAISHTGMYKFSTDAGAWAPINTDIKVDRRSPMPMAEHQDTFYAVGADKLFTSEDRGETWNSKGSRPTGRAVGIAITGETPAPITIYLALEDEGIFQSTDGGTQWNSLNNGFSGDVIAAIAAVEGTMFVGTNLGFYRLDSNLWKQIPVNDPSRSVYSLAVSEKNLYVGTGPNRIGVPLPKLGEVYPRSALNFIKIFHSDDFGTSWTDITPPKTVRGDYEQRGITVLPVGDTLLVLSLRQSRSTDGGKTWTDLGGLKYMPLIGTLPAAVGDETTFYRAGVFGIHRTTDAGDSWHLFMDGIVGTRLRDTIVFNNRLYASTGYELYQSTDGGQSWKKVWIDEEDNSLNLGSLYIYPTKWSIDGNNLYCTYGNAKARKLVIYRLSTDGDTLIPVQGVPVFDDVKPLVPQLPPETDIKAERVTVSNDVFYVEYERRLFKWKIGDPAWTDTGFADTNLLYDMDSRKGFRIAVSGETVYVGKRNGDLFQSFDGGNTWRDVTPKLPLQYTHLKKIAFVGPSLYAATDNGVLVSHNGEHWRVLTDTTGAIPIINTFTADANTVYGIGDAGVYRSDARGEWKLMVSEVPNGINAFATINGKLYSATGEHGLLHISFEEE